MEFNFSTNSGSLYCSKVNTHNERADPESSQANGPIPPPPPTLAQAIAYIMESREEQTELLRLLVNNSTGGGNGAGNVHGQIPTTYGEFLATHPPTFTEAGEPLKVDHWLRTIESKFGLLRCTEHQKTLFAAQQLLGNAAAWWANYTTARPAGYQVLWDELREAFHAHHIPAGIMKRKHQKFMDLKQGGRSVHDYSKLFNHLAHYALEQVDIDPKKKGHFISGLSTKLQQRLALNTGGTFLDFMSNCIIADDAIRAHKEGQKRKAIAAPSSSAPPKYRMVYTPCHTHPPRPHQHQHQH
jgi:hypothetical protein